MHKLISTLACIVLLFSMAEIGLSQTGGETSKPKTVWSGVYSEAQADRGKMAFETNCVSCHSSGPPASDVFMRNWSGTDLGGVFDQIKTSMPADAPASLSDRTYVDLLAYILREDAFPSGAAELGQSLLKSIRVEPRDGPQPVPNFALVSVVGCLVQDVDKGWRLAEASEPVRTKDPEVSKMEEFKAAQSTASGAQQFRLTDVYPAPDSFKGSRVEVKGFLIREGQENRLNVTSIQSFGTKCDLLR